MTIPRVTMGLSGVLIAILAVGFVAKSCQHPDDPGAKIPPAQQRTIDSLDRTAPDFHHTQDSLRTIVIHDTVQSVAYQAAAARARSDARAAQARADALADDARVAGDSAAAWRRAYEARTSEAVGLRETVRDDSLALRSEISARLALASAYGADTLRRRAVEDLNTGLRRTIGTLERPCRIVGPIPCPSRTASAVGAALLGAVAGRKL